MPTYLALVFHAVALVDSRYWLTPLGAVLAIVMVAGVAAGIVCLMRSFRVADDRAIGEIVGLTYHDAIATLLVEE